MWVVLVAVVSVVVCSVPCQDSTCSLDAPTPIHSWVTLGGGSDHSGYVPVIFPGKSSLGLLWSTNIGIGPLTPAAVDGSRVYVSTAVKLLNASLVALHTSNGTLDWSTTFTDTTMMTGPSLGSGGTVAVQRIVAGSDGKFEGMTATNGAHLWTTEFGSAWFQYNTPTPTGAGTEQRWYANGGEGGGLYSFDGQGKEKFYTPLADGAGSSDTWSPTISSTGSLFAFVGPSLAQYGTDQGSHLWSIRLAPKTIHVSTLTPVVKSVALVLLRGTPGHLLGVNITTHNVMWNVTCSTVSPGVAPATDGQDVFVCCGNALQGWRLRDGHPMVKYPTPMGCEGQPVVTDDALMVSGGTQATYVFDKSAGNLLTTLGVGGSLSLGDNMLVLTMQNGTVAAYGTV